MKWKLIKNCIPSDVIEYLQDYTLKVRHKVEGVLNEEKNIGSGTYWKGVDMASSFPLASEEENKKLFDIYTSLNMYELVANYIDFPYLFNDQIVVKLPGEDFDFKPHYDNQFGPYPDDKELVTKNFMLVLDDFTKENGGIKILDGEWIELYPEKGDILMIDGNTVHASGNNNSHAPRRAYLCVYSNKPIGKNFQKGFYYQPFIDYVQ